MFQKFKNVWHFKKKIINISNRDFLIRKANFSDIPAMINIEEAVYSGRTPWNGLAFDSEIRNFHDNLFLLMTDYKRENIIGFIGLSIRRKKRDLHITNIAVLPIWQGIGIGSYLIEIAFNEAEKLKLPKVSLEVKLSNQKAHWIYKKKGFKDITLLREYYEDDGEDAYEMEYIL